MADFACLLCASDATPMQIAAQVRDSAVHRVVRCPVCGHVQLTPVPSEAELAAYYQAETQRKAVHGHLTREQKRRHVQADTERRMQLVQKCWPDDVAEMSVLDIGCGEGFLGEALQRVQNLRYVGWELGDALAKDRFHVVSLFHVLEHMPQPIALLRAWWDHLKVGGHLIIEVPNHDDWLIAACPAYAAWHYQQAHLHYFTARSLLHVINASGIVYRWSKLFGVQRYGMTSENHWITKGKPSIDIPVGYYNPSPTCTRLEKDYRHLRETTLTCDTLCVVLQK